MERLLAARPTVVALFPNASQSANRVRGNASIVPLDSTVEWSTKCHTYLKRITPDFHQAIWRAIVFSAARIIPAISWIFARFIERQRGGEIPTF